MALLIEPASMIQDQKLLRAVSQILQRSVRDRVAHGQDLVSGTDWQETIDLVEQLDLVLEKLPDQPTAVSNPDDE